MERKSLQEESSKSPDRKQKTPVPQMLYAAEV